MTKDEQRQVEARLRRVQGDIDRTARVLTAFALKYAADVSYTGRGEGLFCSPKLDCDVMQARLEKLLAQESALVAELMG